LGGCLGVEPRKFGIALTEGLCDWENYILAFALQLRKITENLSQGSQIVVSTGCLDWPAGLLTVGDFSQPLVGTSAFEVAR
jgi:hypothetical protein